MYVSELAFLRKIFSNADYNYGIKTRHCMRTDPMWRRFWTAVPNGLTEQEFSLVFQEILKQTEAKNE